eukprot:3203577-Pyramimonas_sp.AAC.1
MKYLGAMFDPTGSIVSERKARVKALRMNWSQFYGVWFTNIPKAVKRAAYISRAQGAALSGMTSLVLQSVDCRALEYT